MEENYELLPKHMRDGAQMYVKLGVPPGGFLTAVLSNNFKEAFARADDINIAYMGNWAQWVVWHCPAEAQGSVAKVQAWIKRCGLKGITREPIEGLATQAVDLFSQEALPVVYQTLDPAEEVAKARQHLVDCAEHGSINIYKVISELMSLERLLRQERKA